MWELCALLRGGAAHLPYGDRPPLEVFIVSKDLFAEAACNVAAADAVVAAARVVCRRVADIGEVDGPRDQWAAARG